jgi:hypothetical protein
MNTARIAGLLGGALLVACGAAVAATSQAEYRAALRSGAAHYNAARAHCRTLAGQEKRVCIAEAKGGLERADAEAEAAYRDTSRARLDAQVAIARADYNVAKVKCNERSGAARKACIEEARARRSDAVVHAMRTPQ